MSQQEKNLARVDAMPAGLRRCVHEYGLPIVHACIEAGVKDQKRIHNLVREIWDGARQRGQRNFQKSSRCSAQDTLDWILVQSGSDMSAETLVRVLWEHSLVIVPKHPTPRMVEASKVTVSGFNQVVTKTQKHHRRLEAAILAAAEQLWPYAFRETIGAKSQNAILAKLRVAMKQSFNTRPQS